MYEMITSFNMENLPYYLLLFVRMTGLFVVAPVFSRKNVPGILKTGLSVLLTVLLAGAFPPQTDFGSIHILTFLVDIFLELVIGTMLGFIVLLFFSVAQVAGQVIDVETGMGMASVLDPQSGSQISISGTMLHMMILLYFLINNGHLKLIRLLARSVERIPVGGVSLSLDLALFSAEQFGIMFGLAASLMLPIIGAALLTETGMGILMRAIPQLNAYMVGIPLKVLVGFSVLYFLQPFYVGFCDWIFEQMFAASEQAVVLMGGAT